MVAPMAQPRPEEPVVERAGAVNDLVQGIAWHAPADLQGRERLHLSAKHRAAPFEQIAALALLAPDDADGEAQRA